MRFYTSQHKYYCVIDLHTKNMYICIPDQAGNTLLHYDAPADVATLSQFIKPYLPNIVIAAECIFTWYWIADFCAQHNITFVLGHARCMKAIHRACEEMSESYSAALLNGADKSKIPRL